MGFPTQVNVNQAVAVEGDFASANPRASVLTVSGGLYAGSAGVVIGRFAWVDPANTGSPLVTNAAGSATRAPDGFVHRRQGALITTFLGEVSQTIPSGYNVTLHSAGDFFARNNSGGAVAAGATVYANYADGSLSFAASAGVNVATKFTVKTAGANGDLVKISTW